MDEYITAFLEASNYADTTRESYRYALSRLDAWLSERGLTIDDLTVERYLKFLNGHGWSNNMRRLYASAVRVFLRWLGFGDHPVFKIKLPVDNAKPGRSLAMDEVRDLLASFNTMTPLGWRNVAMLALMIETGLRAAEICRLALIDVDLKKRKLVVLAKKQVWREGKFSEQVAMYLASWLAIRPDVAAKDCKSFFVSLKGKKPGTQMTPSGLRSNFHDIGVDLNLRLSPHDLRRTMAMLLTEAGAPSRLVQVLGGWEDIRMVERYTRNLLPSQIDRYSPISALMGQTQNLDRLKKS